MNTNKFLELSWEYLDVIVTTVFFIGTMAYLAMNGMEKALLPGGLIASLYMYVRFRK
ncbi:MAG: hypothetical protein ACPGVL_04100 [Pseudoalteromonas spongiae]|jgi:hypothetical protein|uniref:Uncharacterized protein n=1 Tax=Pseudoalteromonas spongiae TaxID=298657 RepID=A0ABU8EUQ5_9GAMM|nr:MULTISPECIES: hypothetical protein [Pseudoalteromonas]ATC99963.1 hypothetical protein PSPO_a3115 [Pseudoalteromonas spongiae UST010723-006]MCF6456354.1 hypothetical protein [Pseudoalteromonas sp. MMG024]MEC8328085.1 hypothetical protein [Pseudomonadota bacterium]